VDIARQREARVVTVASKVKSAGDSERLQQMLGEPVSASVPADEAVAACDREGLALIDHAPESPAARAIEGLVDGLVRDTLRP
jgi:Flp pilus assembly CpaE family ATPase